MINLSIDRWFVWTIAIAIAIGIGLWWWIQTNVIEMDAELQANAVQILVHK